MRGFCQSYWFRGIASVLVLSQVNLNFAQAQMSLGGGGSSTASVNETRYVGNLYEEDAAGGTSFVYLGNIRVAAVGPQGEVSYYHGDHLGGTNVITDEIGAKKELIEYQPFGTTARRELYPPAEQTASRYYTGQVEDEEIGLYYYGARYYNPELGRFIQPDDFVPSPGNPQAFNRYSYVYNNPLILTDPDGNFPWFAFAIGALIAGGSAAIQSYQETGKVSIASVAINAVIGGFSGATLSASTTAASLKIVAFPKTSIAMLKTSALMSLGSQVAGASGLGDASRYLGQGSQYLGMAFTGLHIGVGVANWIHDPRFQNIRVAGEGSQNAYQSNDKGFVNGVLTSREDAISRAIESKASVLSYNPTSSPIADLTESALSKILFTGSVERQVTRSLRGLSNIRLEGFSQGGIIASNTALHLGLTDQRTILRQLTVGSSQISQIRAVVSGAIGAGLKFSDGSLVYGVGSPLDFSNALGPNLMPHNFVGGLIGASILPVGIKNHKYPF